jgi:hypothetical protein
LQSLTWKFRSAFNFKFCARAIVFHKAGNEFVIPSRLNG